MKMKTLVSHSLTALVLFFLTTTTTSLQAADCSKQPDFSIKLYGSFKRSGLNFKDDFRFISTKKSELSQTLTFINKQHKSLVIKTIHLPSTVSLVKDQTYTISGVLFKVLGRFQQYIDISDDKGSVVALANSARHTQNPKFELKFTEDYTCSSYTVVKAAIYEADAKKAEISMSQSKDVTLEGKKYGFKLVRSMIHSKQKGITIDRNKLDFGFILYRK